MKHSWLDFTAARTTNDFFHAFSNFISEKNILSTIFSYTAVAPLILLLIIILPCIVKTLRQNTQKLMTELHLAVLKNKKGGDAGSQHRRSHPWQGHGRRSDRQGGSGLEGLPGPAQASTPKPKSVCLLFTIVCLSPTLLTLTGDCPQPPFSEESQLKALVNKSPGLERSILILTPLSPV